MAPDTTIAACTFPGRKKQKDRFTVLVCGNADVSQKFDLMLIGHAERPRPFIKKNGRDYAVDYHNKKIAWMTADLFYSWLLGFDNFIVREEGCPVVLLIDNCSAHGTVETLPTLARTTVEFLPPNTRSKIQPCDGRIIAAMKVHYRVLQMDRSLDLAEANPKNS